MKLSCFYRASYTGSCYYAFSHSLNCSSLCEHQVQIVGVGAINSQRRIVITVTVTSPILSTSYTINNCRWVSGHCDFEIYAQTEQVKSELLGVAVAKCTNHKIIGGNISKGKQPKIKLFVCLTPTSLASGATTPRRLHSCQSLSH